MHSITRLGLGLGAALVLAGCNAPSRLPADSAALDRPFITRFGVPGDLPTEDGRPGPALATSSPWRLFARMKPSQPVEKPAPPVPQPLIEPVPKAPKPGLAWQPNTWEWNGQTFVWQPGRFVSVPVGVHWEYGGWRHDEVGALVWRTGGWTSETVRTAVSDLLPMNP